ncbi:Disease resistance protein [Melia azedarach]|uniref:Disease resistance protein n=1 Tax=Melia azedarach TaxID=155640 RepID=A0ACC1YJ37_MELAZ|nr:Disease resistance protein [Melia azedarach]
MSIIGETIVSVSTGILFRKLVSSDLLQFAKQEQIRGDLKKWGKLLVKIKAVLNDAEEKQATDRAVRIWLGDLQELAYDVEDMLEEFEYEALRRKLLVEAAEPSSCVFLKLVRTCANFSLRAIKFDSMMRSKIKDITARFQEIVRQKDQLGLDKNSGGRSEKFKQRLPTTSLVNEAKVYGREKEKEEIVELLLRDDLRSDDGFSVIPIVGIGGVGKTTLAQLVYNDDRMKCHYDVKAWICVSEDFDVGRVTKTILRSIDDSRIDDDDLNLLQEKLKKELCGKKFLFILDDIWNENYNDWSVLSCPFEAGAPGSKIVVTTRNQDVATMMGTVPSYQLKVLSNDDCLCIFTQHSLGTRDFGLHPSLKEIGEKIVIKCQGLPLAAKTLGGLLHGKYDRSDWEDVLQSKIWNLSEERCDIIPALRVSYHYLSPRLKQCFAFCSLFPKDYEFQEEEIILLWMAEGFLHHENSDMQKKDLGYKFFDELHSRSFFQQSSSNASRYVMHDLINDLAQWAAGEIYFRMEDMLECKKQQEFSVNLRHLSYIRGQYDGMKRFEIFNNVKHLRTFLPIVLRDTWSREVLSLKSYCLSELPMSIGDLKHLRYLNLSETRIKALPESVNKLYNLDTLLLEDCHRLKKICPDMGNLIKLRHLNNSNVDSLEEMPLRIGKLTCLEKLCYFVVGKDGSRLRELKFLSELQDTLKISRLENLKYVDDAMEANINGKSKLKALLLEWSISTSNSMEPETETRVLDMLKPHQDLKELTIKNYGGTKFPVWLEDYSLSNLVLIRFEFCHRCTSLPSMGHLPCLKYLFISGMDGVKSVGPEFYGNGISVPFPEIPFPSLETLCFQDMQEWEKWIHPGSGQEVECYSKLRELCLVNCSKLQGNLPEHLPSVEKLVIEDCKQLLLSIPSLPKLRKLEISGCKEVMWRSTINLSQLKSVVFGDISNQAFLTGLLQQELPNLKELEIECCEELTCLWQNGSRMLQEVSSIHESNIGSPLHLSLSAEEEQDQQHQRLPRKLQYLKLKCCQALVTLPEAVLSLNSLRHIEIFDCNSLVSFPEAALPSQLKTITIMYCNALKSLPEVWMHNSSISLESLYIAYCNSLTYIARIQLPPSLKRLEIKDCNNLKTLIDKVGVLDDGERYTCVLENLIIGYCENLEYLDELPATLQHLDLGYCSKLAFFRGNLPKSLKYFHAYACPKLESIGENLDNTSFEVIMISSCNNLKFLPNGLCKLRNLQEICVRDCPNLVSFCKGVLLSIKLTKLVINRCEKLETLPNCSSLSSLQNLAIEECPRIASIPEYGIPTNLTSLRISDKNCKPFFKWGLSRFTSLKKLYIRSCLNVVSFPQEESGMLLPASLSLLDIFNFPNLECLSSKVESLTSLESLHLSYCPKLKYFPRNGLPSSLLQLYIKSCPLIEEKCRKGEGQDWHLIIHIPYVSINDSCVLDYATEED